MCKLRFWTYLDFRLFRLIPHFWQVHSKVRLIGHQKSTTNRFSTISDPSSNPDRVANFFDASFFRQTRHFTKATRHFDEIFHTFIFVKFSVFCDCQQRWSEGRNFSAKISNKLQKVPKYAKMEFSKIK